MSAIDPALISGGVSSSHNYLTISLNEYCCLFKRLFDTSAKLPQFAICSKLPKWVKKAIKPLLLAWTAERAQK